jgi:trimeric autotransporter adhesin
MSMTGTRLLPRTSKLGIVVTLATCLAVALPSIAWALVAEAPIAGTIGTAGGNSAGQINSVVQIGNTLYLGGEFTSAGGQARNRLAAVNATTGQLLAWNPGANGNVYTMMVGPDGNLIVGGAFGNAGGSEHRNIAKISPTTGQAINTFNPTAEGGAVWALGYNNGNLYIGGQFETVNGQPRNHLAALDPTTGAPTEWNPGASGTEQEGRPQSFAFAADNSVYVGGFFTSIGGQLRSRVAKLDPVTGLADPAFNANLAIYGRVNKLRLVGDALFMVGGGRQPQVSSVNRFSGVANWRHLMSGDITALAIAPSGTVYIAGHFGFFGVRGCKTRGTCLEPRRKTAALDMAGNILDWEAPTNGSFGVADVAVINAPATEGLAVVGEFTMTGRQPRTNFAIYRGTP